jgi:hypothetical protein
VADEFEAVQWRDFVAHRGGAGEDSIDYPPDEGRQRRRRRTIDVATPVVGVCGSLQFLDVGLD